MADSPAILVARFLRTNGYNQTLQTFLQEAGLPNDTGMTGTRSFTIESLLHEKKLYDVTQSFEKAGIDEEGKGWKAPGLWCGLDHDWSMTGGRYMSSLSTIRGISVTLPVTPIAPSKGIPLELPSSANILCSSTETVELESGCQNVIVTSTADHRLTLLSVENGKSTVITTRTDITDSPILSYQLVKGRFMICGGMSGTLSVFDFQKLELLSKRKDHAKYVVGMAATETNSMLYLATAGWDSKIFLYSADSTDPGTLNISEPIATLTLPSNPESITFVSHPDTAEPILIVGRRDSTFLHFYRLPRPSAPALHEIGKQNLAPHSNAWVAFSPCAIAASPVEPLTVAVATSSTPHMKIIIARLLLPTLASDDRGSPDGPGTHADLARAELARQHREDAALCVHVSAFAPQSRYSTPHLAWRPDGSGVWVNGDDGVVRGLEASTGRVVATLEGHEADAKIRCVFAGYLEGTDGRRRECVLSGGFDQRLILWELI